MNAIGSVRSLLKTVAASIGVRPHEYKKVVAFLEEGDLGALECIREDLFNRMFPVPGIETNFKEFLASKRLGDFIVFVVSVESDGDGYEFITICVRNLSNSIVDIVSVSDLVSRGGEDKFRLYTSDGLYVRYLADGFESSERIHSLWERSLSRQKNDIIALTMKNLNRFKPGYVNKSNIIAVLNNFYKNASDRRKEASGG